ncbi:MAG: CoB--CoM heterodisulfide reductase iron-sulfur subunit A family protein [Thermoplasmata archaeon]|nr:MAG: CoB--CoM heterodisulfide reductase iron-sulfur subunit A family protein [Thermoplasmata archaeon]
MRGVKSTDSKVGVFLCTCEGGIGENIDFEQLTENIKDAAQVTCVHIHDRLCGREGQHFLSQKTSESKVERIVIVGCTPRTYGDIVKKGAVSAGVDEHLVEHVNVREHCDWIHSDKESGTQKAVCLVLGGIAKAANAESYESQKITLANSTDVLIIGGGVAGLTSALELLRRGMRVHLVERTEKLGGKAYALDPVRLKDEDVSLPDINVLTDSDNADIMLASEVESISGTLGDYHIVISTGEDRKELVVGAIIAATGSELFDASRLPEYSYDDPDVIDYFEFEKMLAEGKLVVSSTGKVPKNINFIQCVGSRDENKGNAHCSLVCCTYAIGQAARIKALSPDTNVYIHYMDLRGPYNGFEEEFLNAQKLGVSFIRGRVAEVLRNDGRLTLRTEHIELGDVMNLETDMVVLAVGQEPSRGTEKLAEMVRLPVDVDGFMGYYNDRYDIVDRRGISIAGSAQGPRGVLRSVSDAKKSAREIFGVLKNGLAAPSAHSVIDEVRCQGCRVCEALCPYGAIFMKTVKDYITEEVKSVSSVNLAVCQGCGACAMACPAGVPQIIGFSNKEMLAQIDELI